MNWYKTSQISLTALKKEETGKMPLNSEELKQVREKWGKDRECSFAKDEDGYYCYTHRARSESYPSIDKIPKTRVEFIESTG